MNDIPRSDENRLFGGLQGEVSNVLIRHKSILDVVTKLTEYNARIGRSLAKSVTNCGCIKVDAGKQDFSDDNFKDMLEAVKSHLEGDLCKGCRMNLEEEIGSYLFYLAALGNYFNIDLDEILRKETKRTLSEGVISQL